MRSSQATLLFLWDEVPASQRGDFWAQLAEREDLKGGAWVVPAPLSPEAEAAAATAEADLRAYSGEPGSAFRIELSQIDPTRIVIGTAALISTQLMSARGQFNLKGNLTNLVIHLKQLPHSIRRRVEWQTYSEPHRSFTTLGTWLARGVTVGVASTWNHRHRGFNVIHRALAGRPRLGRLLSTTRRSQGHERATLRVVHSVSSMDVGGTQRQVAFFIDPRYRQTLDHIVLSSHPERDFWSGAQGIVDLESVLEKPGLTRFASALRHVKTASGVTYPDQLVRLAESLARLEPDLVVGWGNEHAALAHAATSLAGIPGFVYAIRTTRGGLFDREPVCRGQHRRTRARRSASVANSKTSAADYADWTGLPLDQVGVIYNGIEDQGNATESDREEFRSRLGLRADEVLLGSVGRLSPEKGHAVFVESLAQLDPSLPWRALLIGDGPCEAPLVAQVKRLGLEGRVLFAGRQRNVDSWLSALDVFVLPSFLEGLPNAVMEAMRAGLPCVVSDRGGTPELIRDGVDGFVVPADAGSFAAALSRLVRDPELRARCGASGEARLREAFGVQRMLESYEELFRSLA